MFGVRSSTGNDPESPSSCRCRAVVLPDGSLRAVRWRRVSASAVSEIPALPTSRGEAVGTLGGEERNVTRQSVQSSSEGVFLCENYAYVAACDQRKIVETEGGPANATHYSRKSICQRRNVP